MGGRRVEVVVVMVGLLGACAGRAREEVTAEPDAPPRAPVLAGADAVTRMAVEFWSRVHVAPRPEQGRRTARVPRSVDRDAEASSAAEGTAAPTPTSPPRSASEAAGRRPEPSAAQRRMDPVAPTAPAETRDPFRR